jgi:hypothetical protein
MSLSLAEEYLQRHSIKDVPLVKHVAQGTVFMREEVDDEIEWHLLTIQFSPEGSGHHTGPGSYIIRRLVPNHDGYVGRGSGLFQTVATDTVEWDQYEDFMWAFVKTGDRPKPIIDQREVLMTAWEMFVYACDSGLVAHAANEAFFKTLDPSLTTQQRHMNFTLFSNHFHRVEPTLFELWNREFLTHVKNHNHCLWLAKLMDGQRVG